MVTQSWTSGLAVTRAISQFELHQLQQLQALRSDYDRLRKSILERMEQGAIVEPGKLNVRVDRRWQRRLNRRVLEQIVGVTETNEIYDELQPSESRFLKVYRADNVVEI